MQKFFVDEKQINLESNTITIEGEDINHIKNVLRLGIRDKIQINTKSSNPSKYTCEIVQMSSKQIECNIIKKEETNNESNIKLYIYQGLPKSEKMELIIQKCTELGVYEFIPVLMNRCVVKLNNKDTDKKIARWNKISEVAAKQCKRDIIPIVRHPITIKELTNECNKYDIVLIAYENETNTFLKNEIKNINISKNELKIAIVIGPEGGIEEDEIDNLKKSGAKIISLGKRILRTETVGIVLSSIIMYELGDIGG